MSHKKSEFYHSLHFIKYFLELSSNSHSINIWQKNVTHSIMANRIGRSHKVDKQNINWSDMTTNLLTVPVSISKCHNKNIKTLIWHLTHHPLTLHRLLPLLMYMRKLLTPLKNNLQTTFEKNKISNVAVDENDQSFETSRKKLQRHFTKWLTFVGKISMQKYFRRN